MASGQSAISQAHGASHQTPPEDAFQGWLAAVWRQMLRCESLGIDDDFFALGGTAELGERMFDEVARICNERLSAPETGSALTIRGVAQQIVARVEARAQAPAVLRTPAPPRARPSPAENVLHDQLLGLWAEALGADPRGVDDDFFALGGTPERCERMLGGVEDVFGERIAAADFEGVRTVRGLADRLVARLSDAPISQIQAGAPGVPPLFFLPGDIGGGGYYVRPLARGLGLEQPVFTLRQHGMGDEEVPSTVEEMAADYARRVQDAWPDGALHLAGRCASAIIALEVALQLVREGRNVASLLMIEPAAVRLSGLPTLPMPRLSLAARRLPRIRNAWLDGRYREILQTYQLPVYDGRTIVFWACEERFHDHPEMKAAILRLAPRVETHLCPGTHNTALTRHVQSLAMAMKAALAAGAV